MQRDKELCYSYGNYGLVTISTAKLRYTRMVCPYATTALVTNYIICHLCQVIILIGLPDKPLGFSSRLGLFCVHLGRQIRQSHAGWPRRYWSVRKRITCDFAGCVFVGGCKRMDEENGKEWEGPGRATSKKVICQGGMHTCRTVDWLCLLEINRRVAIDI